MNEDERKIQWCLKKEQGISLISPNENLAKAYVVKAKEAADVMRTLQEKKYGLGHVCMLLFHVLFALRDNDEIGCKKRDTLMFDNIYAICFKKLL